MSTNNIRGPNRLQDLSDALSRVGSADAPPRLSFGQRTASAPEPYTPYTYTSSPQYGRAALAGLGTVANDLTRGSIPRLRNYVESSNVPGLEVSKWSGRVGAGALLTALGVAAGPAAAAAGKAKLLHAAGGPGRAVNATRSAANLVRTRGAGEALRQGGRGLVQYAKAHPFLTAYHSTVTPWTGHMGYKDIQEGRRRYAQGDKREGLMRMVQGGAYMVPTALTDLSAMIPGAVASYDAANREYGEQLEDYGRYLASDPLNLGYDDLTRGAQYNQGIKGLSEEDRAVVDRAYSDEAARRHFGAARDEARDANLQARIEAGEQGSGGIDWGSVFNVLKYAVPAAVPLVLYYAYRRRRRRQEEERRREEERIRGERARS